MFSWIWQGRGSVPALRGLDGPKRLVLDNTETQKSHNSFADFLRTL